MSASWAYAIISVVLVSLVSLIGIALLLIAGERRLKKWIFILVSLSVGGLLGDAFIHLLPESLERFKSHSVCAIMIIIGILIFFVLEKFLHWRHDHSLNGKDHILPVGYMNLVAEAFHNLFDGLIIGSSYMVNIHLGLTTTIAVVLHEIPHEIGNFGILIHSGFIPRRAILLNFYAAVFAVLGAPLAILASSYIDNFSNIMLPVTAGGFIYISASDLIPELHKDNKPFVSILQLLAMVTGVLFMLLLTVIE